MPDSVGLYNYDLKDILENYRFRVRDAERSDEMAGPGRGLEIEMYDEGRENYHYLRCTPELLDALLRRLTALLTDIQVKRNNASEGLAEMITD